MSSGGRAHTFGAKGATWSQRMSDAIVTPPPAAGARELTGHSVTKFAGATCFAMLDVAIAKRASASSSPTSG